MRHLIPPPMLVLLALAGPACAAPIRMETWVVVSPPGLTAPEGKAVLMLLDEVQKRTQIRLRTSTAWSSDAAGVIWVGLAAGLESSGGPHTRAIVAERGPEGAEGYRIRTVADSPIPSLLVIGNDARGVLFGVGRLLRSLQMDVGRIALPAPLNISTAPRYRLRGHQVSYRSKSNSYDGWTVGMREQYIRDMAVFGTNAIEILPPRTDDLLESPHHTLAPMQMMAETARLLDAYGLDVWIWYPLLEKDYSDPKTIEIALAEWEEVFRQLPRVDGLFLPAANGEPKPPKQLFPFAEKAALRLRRHHAKAQIWISPQMYPGEWLDEFFEMLRREPGWLNGVVFGPSIRMSLPAFRKAVPGRYPVRFYPDITHSASGQYPVADWDAAFALTLGREGINPRPLDQAAIFRLLQPSAEFGFSTYSEGCNDDVNKVVWSSLGWDPDADVVEILRQYGRYFIGAPYADDFAQGLLALERNWRGPLPVNKGVYSTLAQFQVMERRAAPQVLANWRFQQALYRAYYDALVRSRLLYESGLEEEALARLREAGRIGSTAAMEAAVAVLERAKTRPVAQDWRARIFELGDALFQSIRMQLSVPRHQASAVRRGANLDCIDAPLNNGPWLLHRFAQLRRLKDEAERLKGIREILDWDNPGPGGFYDDLGDPSSQPHLVCGPSYERDPGFLESPLVNFPLPAADPTWPVSWRSFVEANYDAPILLRYTGLDPAARYLVRVVYGGEDSPHGIRLMADEAFEIHPYRRKDWPVRPVEFDIPPQATEDGELTLKWTRTPGLARGAGCQVAEVWLIRK